jgi:hypothetical protein
VSVVIDIGISLRLGYFALSKKLSTTLTMMGFEVLKIKLGMVGLKVLFVHNTIIFCCIDQRIYCCILSFRFFAHFRPNIRCLRSILSWPPEPRSIIIIQYLDTVVNIPNRGAGFLALSVLVGVNVVDCDR